MRLFQVLVPIALLVGLTVGRGAEHDKAPNRIKEGLDAFQAYLTKEYPGKKYKIGPHSIDSAALRAAYPQQRFCYVYTFIPLPPGANLKEVQEAHRREVEAIRKNYLSLTVRVDEKRQVAPLGKPESYNAGLMKVASDDDAQTATAAILTLHATDWNAPGVVEAKEVTVKKSDKGWLCEVNRRSGFRGTVAFDAEGNCRSVSKDYTGSLPP